MTVIRYFLRDSGHIIAEWDGFELCMNRPGKENLFRKWATGSFSALIRRKHDGEILTAGRRTLPPELAHLDGHWDQAYDMLLVKYFKKEPTSGITYEYRPGEECAYAHWDHYSLCAHKVVYEVYRKNPYACYADNTNNLLAVILDINTGKTYRAARSDLLPLELQDLNGRWGSAFEVLKERSETGYKAPQEEEMKEEIQIGDRVTVTASIKCYSRYVEWAERYLDTEKWLAEIAPDEGAVCTVLVREPHLRRRNVDLVGIEDEYGQQYVMGTTGVKRMETKATFSVGDYVEITRPGQSYPDYDVWAKRNNFQGFKPYSHGDCENAPKKGDRGTVKARGIHGGGRNPNQNVLLGVVLEDGRYVILDERAVKRAEGADSKRLQRPPKRDGYKNIFKTEDGYVTSARFKIRLGNSDIVTSPALGEGWEKMWAQTWKEGECALVKANMGAIYVRTQWDEKFRVELGGSKIFLCWYKDMRPLLSKFHRDTEGYSSFRTATVLELEVYRQPVITVSTVNQTLPQPKAVVAPEWPEGNHPSRVILEDR